MISVIQRVTQASVTVNQVEIGKIDQGILAFIGIETTDTQATVHSMLEKMANYRIFSDNDGKMNLSVTATHGGILLVPQFTLVAETSKGRRPSFAKAASPKHGGILFNYIKEQAHNYTNKAAFGKFGANMQVSLTNDGPVTFILNC